MTGGAGFIGSHLTETLVHRGDQVRVVDDLSTGCLGNLEGVSGEIEFTKGDIRDQALISELLRGVEYVFHQAAFVSVPLSLEQPDFCFDVNVRGTAQLMSAAREAGVKRMVIASSAAVYGNSQELPLQESSRVDPLSPYAVSKRVGELYAKIYSKGLGLNVVALRYFNVFGPRQSPTSDYAAVIPKFIQRFSNNQPPVIFGDGNQTRDFIYVKDIVKANLLAAEAEQAPGQALNVCSGEATSLLALAAALGTIFNSKQKAVHQKQRPGDINRSVGDPSLAAEVLKFQPDMSLSQGLQETVFWMITQKKT